MEGYNVEDSSRNVIGVIRTVQTADGSITLDRPVESNIEPGTRIQLTAGEEAPILASRLVTGTRIDQSLPPIQLRLGTTRGTNAILERKGARTALITNAGFEDIMEIGNQQRPDIFDIRIDKPEQLYSLVTGLDCRIEGDGKVSREIPVADIEGLKAKLVEHRIEAVAISFVHSYKNPVHEQHLMKILRSAGFNHIASGSDLYPVIHILPRTQTALADAYLQPVLNAYYSGIRSRLDSGSLHNVTSAGLAVRHDLFHAKDALLSGPSGGVRAAVALGKQYDINRLITFDMGGTSTDCSRVEGQETITERLHIDRLEIATPAIAIETVAAGGGSICRIAHGKLTVGPDSAGAYPGPACYGAGGPLTITDINLLLGRLDPDELSIPISVEAAATAFESLLDELPDEDRRASKGDLLRGFLEIANERMAGAIRKISVTDGYDPREYSLLSFGGAGGLHACQIASGLGISEVIFPYDSGLFSAVGVGRAPVARIAKQQVNRLLTEVHADLDMLVENTCNTALTALGSEGIPESECIISRRQITIRYKGQSSAVQIEYKRGLELPKQFELQYRATYGYLEDLELEVEGISVTAEARISTVNLSDRTASTIREERTLSEYFNQDQFTPVYHWGAETTSGSIEGPALIVNPFASFYIPHGWHCTRESSDLMRCRQSSDAGTDILEGKSVSALDLELFSQRFQSIADEMGAQLQRTAVSVNVKQRLDFSCALLDPHGQLVANAAHIPVHLGSMGLFGRKVLEKLPLAPGEIAVSNHPAYGGSHLPDISTIAGAFDSDGTLIGYVVTRAHHAEIGGIAPGSMPVSAKNLADEGVVITPSLIAKDGKLQLREFEHQLRADNFPSRNPAENMADIKAAVAATHRGIQGLKQLCDRYGSAKVNLQMKEILTYSGRVISEAITRITPTDDPVRERLDSGATIKVAVKRDNGSLCIDFSGSDPVTDSNHNATEAIVRSAVLYVLRLIAAEPIPLNEGMIADVEIVLPECFLAPGFVDDPTLCPAVAAGNTETSQRLTDALLRAMTELACGQGTMNNVLFGNENFGYYETVGGGAGAGPSFHGASGVHQHMTNTRITDPEELETNYPVRLVEFSLRQGSGGSGKFNGGNGVIRKLQFTQPVVLTFLGEHRIERPYGRHGGEAGQPGRQFVIRNNGEAEELSGSCEVSIEAGETFVLESPGGGGYGTKTNDQAEDSSSS